MAAASDSYNSDVLVIANAFQKACEEDTRQVLNAMAGKKTPSSLNALTFFLIPSTWMVKAWPMLSARPTTMAASSSNDSHSAAGDDEEEDKWREKVGIIQNSVLLAWDHAVSSSDDEEGADNSDTNNNNNGSSSSQAKLKSKKQQPSPDSCPLRRDLKHGEDFFLLGANGWLLVKEKFGSDGIEIGRPCVFHNAEESTLAVVLDRSHQNGGTNGAAASQGQVVTIPPAGYFPYPKLIEDLKGDSQENFLLQQAPLQPQQHSPELKSSDVVSDEEGEPNDLFPDPNNNGPDDMVLTGESPAALPAPQDSVLLLPPSTTDSSATNNNNNNGSPSYPNVQGMRVGDPVDGEGEDSTTNAAVVPVVAQNTRKRYGSGLANLGNTCFMNSTLQCLAHTDPLRRYFLSGEFTQDLNRENPLGTGGDLASRFAQLLAEMWGTAAPPDRRNVFPKIETSTFVSSTASSVVYPRDFKYTLGRHAEQFVGYDQHDSQEFATYLLDALHEDTNRVTKKPYTEKPEKDEDESDEVAAKKSWDLHLKREDSRVLENFMGQVKSRVQCCMENCGRVSTTFDPFMYLSVPLPGSTERTFRVTFVPLDGQQRRKTLSVTLGKSAAMSKLLTRVAEQLMKVGYSVDGRPFALDDLCACDVWGHEVHTWYANDLECDTIRDSDATLIFQVKPTAEIKSMEKEVTGADLAAEDERIGESLEASHRPLRYKADMTAMVPPKAKDDWWKEALENYTTMPNMQLVKILNPSRGTNGERFDLFKKLDEFIDACTRESDKASNKRAREEEGGNDESPSPRQEQTISADSECVFVTEDEEDVPALLERSEASPTFTQVKTRYDLAVLDKCASKLRRMLLDSHSIKSAKKKMKDGCLISVSSRKDASRMGSTSSFSSTQEKKFGHPLGLRIPSSMTVFGFREELAKRLARSLRLGQPTDQEKNPAGHVEGLSPESDVIPMEGESDRGDEEQQSGAESMSVSSEPQSHSGDRDPALLVLRQLPLFLARKTSGYHRYGATKKLGSLESESSYDGSRPIKLASPSDEDEQQLVSDLVGHLGQVIVDWPAELCDRVFDEKESELSEEIKDPDEEEAIAARNRKANRVTTLLDCVAKYCQEEQLEETEVWYCSQCKAHVRAWKQFTIYTAPPILIMHLKRFQYSASTHRRGKINLFIDFPLTGLDFAETVMHWAEGEKPVYDCYGVSNHYGGLGGGHYTAYALNDDGVWCHYDDSRITENVDPKDVVSDAAYMVYYRRRDVVVSGDDFLNGLETPAIVTDHMDSRARTPSETSSTNAAQGDDMDVDIHNNTDADSKASSKTYSSPMESHDGGDDNNYGDSDDIFGGGHNYYDSAPGDDDDDDDNNASYPLQ